MGKGGQQGWEAWHSGTAGGRQGTEGSRERVAKFWLRGEHGTLGCMNDGWGRAGTRESRARLVQ